MSVRVALFRGINVGGKNRLPMQALRDILAGLGCSAVRTYIQSGNAVFRADDEPDDLAERIAAAVDDRSGFRPRVLVLGAAGFNEVVAGNPWPEADPGMVHAWFFAEPPPEPDLEALAGLRAAGESFELGRRAFYLLAPAGIGRSRLAARVEKALGVDATARNWRTVMAVQNMAAAIS